MSRLQRTLPDRHLISPRAPDEGVWSGSPAEWSDFVRHGRELHGSVQGPYGVAGRAGTVSGQCTWTLHRLPVRTISKEATWRLRPVRRRSRPFTGFSPTHSGVLTFYGTTLTPKQMRPPRGGFSRSRRSSPTDFRRDDGAADHRDGHRRTRRARAGSAEAAGAQSRRVWLWPAQSPLGPVGTYLAHI